MYYFWNTHTHTHTDYGTRREKEKKGHMCATAGALSVQFWPPGLHGFLLNSLAGPQELVKLRSGQPSWQAVGFALLPLIWESRLTDVCPGSQVQLGKEFEWINPPPFSLVESTLNSFMMCHLFSYKALIKKVHSRGAWVAQWDKRPTWAQVMISQFTSSSPTSGSVLTAQSLEPALDSVSPPLCPFPAHALSLSLNNK